MFLQQLKDQLQLLKVVLFGLNKNQAYTTKIEHLDGATIGAHTRHIIELINTIVEGYHAGEIGYTHRKRNLFLETDMQLAIQAIDTLLVSIDLQDKELVVLTDNILNGPPLQSNSTYHREIVYGCEHTIHHFALIKVGLIEMKQPIPDPNFGVAHATIRYKESLQSS